MDKSAIKAYAVEARQKLIEAVRQKAYSLYLFEDGAVTPEEALHRLRADNVFLTPQQSEERQRFAETLAALGDTLDSKAAYQHMVEEVAYTWFNRLIALRFMEVNDYLPSGIRILSSREQGRAEPDAMREADRLDFVDPSKIAVLRADTAINAAEKLYKYILIAQCNALSAILPGMFQKANDYTELLLPDVLIAKDGIVYDLIHKIHEKNFKIRTPRDDAAIAEGTLQEEDAPAGQIEIIGWLYQYYISEKKDEVFANLKKSVKINRDTIPAITQLFTPGWIVRYMVENSLGRLWLEQVSSALPTGEWVMSKNEELFVNGIPVVLYGLGNVQNFNDGTVKVTLTARDRIQWQRILANNMGWKYYVDEAEQEPEAAERLHVLRSQSPVKRPEDIKLIDPCMGSGHILVYAFDVLFQMYQSEGYSEREIPNLILQNNLHGLDIDNRAGQLAYFALMMKARSYNRRFFRQDNIPQAQVHTPAADLALLEFGSLIDVTDPGPEPVLKTGQQSIDDEGVDEEKFSRRVRDWKFRRLLSQSYDVVVTNPPYMSPAPSQMEWVKKQYPDSKSDLCVVFVERNFELLKSNGYLAMITMHSWMFLSSYEKFRTKLIGSQDIVSMAHLGARAFEEIGGEVVQTTAFVMQQSKVAGYLATYARLVEYNSQQAKEDAFLSGCNLHRAKKENFEKIPGCPVAYWVSDAFVSAYSTGELLEFVAPPKQGSTLGDNERFLRIWHEVIPDRDKWFPCLKGGVYRKWYGNHEYLINWENDGAEIRATGKQTIRNAAFLFQEGISWSRITTSPSFRIMPKGFFFESASGVCFPIQSELPALGFLNSKIVSYFGEILNPTLTLQSGDLSRIPVILETHFDRIIDIVAQNIALSRTDWDSFETSWDFQTHPLIRENTIAAAFAAWQNECETRFQTLKANETELNRIFIDIYGLQDELTPEVDDKDVTVRRADLGRDIRSWISYAVGCMFGRYSLDEPGLAYAGGEFDKAKYKIYTPEDDNIIPIGSADYFDDDIVVRFIDFVRTVYGGNTLGENLNFIADALYPNGSGTAQERIRRYFLGDFYKDHVKTYQKRPIYWLMDSGKRAGFKALFYLHRYDKYTIARARTDYLHPLQRKYDAEIKRLEILSGSTDNAREKAAYRREIDVLVGKIDECRVYDQVVAHIANQQLELDLDDGVKVNYAKFQGVEVPLDNGRNETMDLLGRIGV